ncbi:MAG: hypothetical protein O2854_08445 [Chloroflexi bacterium]|nr:hypothetical protein [Chloroflexota bacterium]
MKLDGINPGTNLVTVSGDVVELLEVTSGGASAKVRYVEVLGGAAAAVGNEDTLYAEDIMTVDDNRFIGPGQTASTAG